MTNQLANEPFDDLLDLTIVVDETGPGQASSSRREAGVAFGLGGVDLAVCAIAAAMVAFLMPIGFSSWWPRLAVLIAATPLGLLYLIWSVRVRDRAAMLLLGFVVTAGVSAALSAAPGVSIVGTVRSNASFFIYLGAACTWSLGNRVSTRGREAVGWTVVGASVVSGAFAVVELLTGSTPGPLQLADGRPPGLAVHPVYFGALVAAGAAWFAYRLSRRVTPADMFGLGLFAGFAGLSGSRIALAAVVLTAVVATARSRERGRWGIVPVVALGGILATVVHRAAGSSGGSTLERRPTSGVSDRFELWSYSLRAWTHEPLLGWGPGRFMAATGEYVSDSFAIRFAHSWPDAHNLALQLLVTVGLVGLAFAIGFGVVAARRARGPLAWMAGAIAIGWLVEPATSATLGLALLLLGASSIERPSRPDLGESKASRVAVSIACLLGLMMSWWYVVSDLTVDVTPPELAGEGALQWWYSYDPSVSNLISTNLSSVEYGGHGNPEALSWARETVDREPDYSEWRAILALRELVADDLGAAQAEAEAALELQPNDRLALSVLYVVAERTDDAAAMARATAGLCALDACPPPGSGDQGDPP